VHGKLDLLDKQLTRKDSDSAAVLQVYNTGVTECTEYKSYHTQQSQDSQLTRLSTVSLWRMDTGFTSVSLVLSCILRRMHYCHILCQCDYRQGSFRGGDSCVQSYPALYTSAYCLCVVRQWCAERRAGGWNRLCLVHSAITPRCLCVFAALRGVVGAWGLRASQRSVPVGLLGSVYSYAALRHSAAPHTFLLFSCP
jgi:hypothetical protein